MLSALKNLKSKTQKKAKELISTITHDQGVSKSISKESHVFPAGFSYVEGKECFPPYVEFGYIEDGVAHSDVEARVARKNKHELYRYTYYMFDKEEWEGHRKEIDSMFNQGEEELKMYQKSMFGHPVSSNNVDHDPVLIAGRVPKEIVKELYSVKSDKIKFAALEENLDEDFIPFPVARLAVAGKDPVCLVDFLEASKCKEYGIDAVTMCVPDENKTRGVRLTLCQDEDGQEIRSYEILNGTYDMDLNWEVEGKKCEMQIKISDNGSVELIESNGVTWDQLAAHKEVKVGRQYEAKPFIEKFRKMLYNY